MERSFWHGVSLALICALAACDSGSSSGGGAPPTTAPTKNPTGHATATVALKLPANPTGSSTGSSRRVPGSISPGTNFLNIIIDGTTAFNSIAIYNGGPPQTFTSSDGNTVAVLNASQANGYFLFVLSIDTLPGKHTFGVNLIGNIPPIVLSEAQATYTLAPGPNTAQTLALNGVLGSGYIECDTPANIALNNNCAGSFDPIAKQYTLTAVAADYEGFPIVEQGIPFDNGSFTVVETKTPAILTITNNGPFSHPGSQLLGPSGSWYVDGSFTYGQPFNVKCNTLGTSTIGLQIAQTGPTNPVTGFNYIYFPPHPEGTSNYPGAKILPVGSKTTNTHSNRNVVTNLATVSCDASLNLTLL